jgi:phosphoenolpyruvate phosphomutase
MTFRNAIRQGKLTRLVGAHDGISAKLIEKAGFEGIWSSGFTISCSHGVPDASVLGKAEFLERAKEMRRAVMLPILADIDTGYGSASHVAYHARDFERAGINGVCIEDKIFPKTNSFVEGGQELTGVEDFCMKIVSAKQHTSFDFFVVARIEAFISGFGLEDAKYRADAYAECGADAILIHSKERDGKDIESFLLQWEKKCPIVIVPTTYPDAFNEQRMRELGVDIVVYANHPLRAMVSWCKTVLKILEKRGLSKDIDDMIAPVQLLFELSGMNEYKEKVKFYDSYGAYKDDDKDIIEI